MQFAGLLRYAAVFAIKGAAGREKFGLVDIKEAAPPVAPAARGAKMPADNGERVVTGARALSPFLGERMAAAHLLGRPVFIRELAPQDLKLEVDQFGSDSQAVRAAHYLSFVVGRAHGRQLTQSNRAAWRARLIGDGGVAPGWLWNCLIALAGGHEADYLDHCRHHAAGAVSAR